MIMGLEIIESADFNRGIKGCTGCRMEHDMPPPCPPKQRRLVKGISYRAPYLASYLVSYAVSRIASRIVPRISYRIRSERGT